MADWRQIQARIRKAKSSPEPASKLAELYDRTRDAMVAFELGRWHEKSGETAQAIQWYTTAAERFRRAQWKTKAQEALARLSGSPGAVAEASQASRAAEPEAEAGEGAPQTQIAPKVLGELITSEGALEPSGRRRRGRRGGRRHRRQPPATEPHEPARRPREAAPSPPPVLQAEPAPESSDDVTASATDRVRPSEAPTLRAVWQTHGRTGEPGLASRLALLESQLRRLIASPLHRLDEAEQAPAGPGVLLLSDADQTTHYYVEACQTLRIGVANLLRGERGVRKGDSFRARFAEHLGISQSQLSKYLREHCAVRWLQLDDTAPQLAHFAIAVLRPALNT